MKTNYLKISNIFRMSIFAFCLLLASTNMMAESVLTKTPVFLDNFNRTEITPGGVPEVAYAVSYSAGATAPSMDGSSKLKLPSKTSMQGDAFVVGSLAGYTLPFATKLSEADVDSLVWTFNARQNYNSRLTGFSRSGAQNGLAIFLCADNADFTLANGYAIINAGDGSGPGDKKFSLAKVSGGLTDNANITWLVTGQTVGNTNRAYMSIKVVYIPSTNTWRLYEREDGTADFMDPLEVSTLDYNYLGSNIDNTFTSATMTSFGYTINYKSMTSALQLLVDNYQVTTYDTGFYSGLSSSNNKTQPYHLQAITKGLNITTSSAAVILYNALGKKIIERNIEGSVDFTNLNQGVYFIKVNTGTKTYTSKFVVR